MTEFTEQKVARLMEAAKAALLCLTGEHDTDSASQYAISELRAVTAVPALRTELGAAAQAEPNLEDIEQYRMQMAGISTAAFGYWKKGDAIHPDYQTIALNDVAELYEKYDALYQKHVAAQAEPVGDSRLSIGMGAVYDFAGFLTTRSVQVIASGHNNAGSMGEALKEFFDKRGIHHDPLPDIETWHTTPSPSTGGEVTDSEMNLFRSYDLRSFTETEQAMLQFLNNRLAATPTKPQDAKDAERYREVRKHDAVGAAIGADWVCGDGTRYADEYRDADVDAAIASTKPEGKQ